MKLYLDHLKITANKIEDDYIRKEELLLSESIVSLERYYQEIEEEICFETIYFIENQYIYNRLKKENNMLKDSKVFIGDYDSNQVVLKTYEIANNLLNSKMTIMNITKEVKEQKYSYVEKSYYKNKSFTGIYVDTVSEIMIRVSRDTKFDFKNDYYYTNEKDISKKLDCLLEEVYNDKNYLQKLKDDLLIDFVEGESMVRTSWDE